MTEQDLEYIKNTIDYMLNNSRHKNHEHVYNNATNSINKLEKAIEVIQCCESDSEQLPSFLYKHEGGLYFKHLEDTDVTDHWNEYLKTR